MYELQVCSGLRGQKEWRHPGTGFCVSPPVSVLGAELNPLEERQTLFATELSVSPAPTVRDLRVCVDLYFLLLFSLTSSMYSSLHRQAPMYIFLRGPATLMRAHKEVHAISRFYFFSASVLSFSKTSSGVVEAKSFTTFSRDLPPLSRTTSLFLRSKTLER